MIVENPAAKSNMAGDLNDSGIFGFRNFVKRSASFTGLASLLTGGGDASEEWDETEIVAEPASHAEPDSGAHLKLPLSELMAHGSNGAVILIQQVVDGLPGPILGAASLLL